MLTISRCGLVQVQVTVANGKIRNVQAIQYPPSDPQSQQISPAAGPTLEREALQTRGAQANAASGATFTSEGFARSLRSALAKANA